MVSFHRSSPTTLHFLFLPCLCVCAALKQNSSPDYETLRIGGLALAVVLFTLGILLILSKTITTTPFCLSVCRTVSVLDSGLLCSTHSYSAVKYYIKKTRLHIKSPSACVFCCFQVEDAAATWTRSKGKDRLAVRVFIANQLVHLMVTACGVSPQVFWRWGEAGGKPHCFHR